MKDEPGYIEALESLCESGNLKVSQLAKGAVWKLSGEDHRQRSAQAVNAGNVSVFLRGRPFNTLGGFGLFLKKNK